MRKFLKNLFFPKSDNTPVKPPHKEKQYLEDSEDLPTQFTTDMRKVDSAMLPEIINRTAEPHFSKNVKKAAMDSVVQKVMDDTMSDIKLSYASTYTGVPQAQINWYLSQNFIGYQLCAYIAQHWLVDKCCGIPAKDAIRNGYLTTVNDGTKIVPKILDEIRRQDVRFKLNHNLEQFVKMGRVFGIRIAKFHVESKDKLYYEKPFNLDGITPGSYKGISQIDPYWMTPELDMEAASDPGSIYFYEPTWWRVNGKRIHRTHLIIMRTSEVADVLKPNYLYGGISVPQKIYERVYAAERTANEAPQLALTKRANVLHTDIEAAIADPKVFRQKMEFYAANRDNYGIKAVGYEDKVEQFDTALADLDEVIMSQYQIAAAAANIPVTKLMKTQLKGFNSEGTNEIKDYNQELESVQTHDLTPFVERHHAILIRSEISPLFSIAPFATAVKWNPVDTVDAETQSRINKAKAETGNILINSGAISAQEELNRVVADTASGYQNIETEEIDDNEVENNAETEQL